MKKIKLWENGTPGFVLEHEQEETTLIHIFQHGRHGVGLGTDCENVRRWSSLLAEWLKLNNFTAR